jgi:hypothetical protein
MRGEIFAPWRINRTPSNVIIWRNRNPRTLAMTKFLTPLIAISSLSLLTACVTPPMGPMIPVRPGDGKSMQEFGQDDDYCQGYANDKVAGRVNKANDEAVRRGLIGTIIGAAIGGAVGNTRGAVIGGTAGAVVGSNTDHGYSQAGVQREYDMAYAQCMASRGNDVPGWYEHPHHHDDYDRDHGNNDRDYNDNDHGDDRDNGPPPDDDHN